MKMRIAVLWRCPSVILALLFASAALGFLPACAAHHHTGGDDDASLVDDDNDDNDDDDFTWTPMIGNYPELYTVWGTSASDVFAAGWADSPRGPGLIFHFNGDSWASASFGSGATELYGIRGASPDNVFSVGVGWSGYGFTEAVMHYDGAAWSASYSEPTLGPWPLTGIWGAGASDVYVVGWWAAQATYDYGGTIIHFDGNTWADLSYVLPPLVGFYAIWGASASDVFIAGDNQSAGKNSALILHGSGSSWAQMDVSQLAGVVRLVGIWGSSPADIFATGLNQDMQTGSILHYDGSAWSVMGGGPFSSLNGVWGTSPSDVYAVGGDKMYTIMHYDGVSWAIADLAAPGSLQAVWGSSPSDVFAVGSDGKGAGVIFHYGSPK